MAGKPGSLQISSSPKLALLSNTSSCKTAQDTENQEADCAAGTKQVLEEHDLPRKTTKVPYSGWRQKTLCSLSGKAQRQPGPRRADGEGTGQHRTPCTFEGRTGSFTVKEQVCCLHPPSGGAGSSGHREVQGRRLGYNASSSKESAIQLHKSD